MTFVAAIATGLLLWVSYPPLFFGHAVWFALIPLLAVLWPLQRRETTGGPSPRPAWWQATRAPGAFLHGYLAGAVFFLLNLQWLHHVTTLGMTMLALYLALYPAVWALFAATVGRPRRWDSPGELARAIALAAAAWTGLEWLRGIALTGFGWNGLGVALGSFNNGGSDSYFMPIAQWAEWIGVTGLSFFVTAQNAFWVGIWRLDRHGDAVGRTRRLAIRLAKMLVAFYAVYVAVFFIGDRRARSVEAAMENAPPLTVALIQPNIPQENKNAYDSFHEIAITLAGLTQQAFESDPQPDIVVWPESSLPAPFYDEVVQDVLRQGRELGEFTHILGIDDQELDAYFNSIAVFRGDPMDAALHRKVHLVPFGEYLPARGFFGRFDYIREQLPGDFKAGDSNEPVPLPLGSRPPPPDNIGKNESAQDPNAHAPSPDTAPSVTLIPLVCFEDTLGRVARRFARPEPQLLVNVTNDAWFRDSAGAEQHLANAVFRSIELRRTMIRAANTGVTAIIDPVGRVAHRIPRLHQGQLTATIPTIGGQTLYARVGDAFSVALLALTAAATLRATLSAPPEKRFLRKESH